MSTNTILSDRYNGFLMGFISQFLLFDFAAPRFQPMKERIHDVFDELNIKTRLPETHDVYVQKYKEVVNQILKELKPLSIVLLDYFSLGLLTNQIIIHGEEVSDIVKSEFNNIIAEYDLDNKTIQNLLSCNQISELKDEELIAIIISIGYDIAAVVIQDVDKEPNTCFVIMPFGEPFSDYYKCFYSKALKLAGYSPLRAWIGLTNESYLNLLQSLTSKCGVALADLTPEMDSDFPNLNVIHEIGLNQGSDNLIFLLKQPGEHVLPSNLIGSAIMEYDPTMDGWPEEICVGLSTHILRIKYYFEEELRNA